MPETRGLSILQIREMFLESPQQKQQKQQQQQQQGVAVVPDHKKKKKDNIKKDNKSMRVSSVNKFFQFFGITVSANKFKKSVIKKKMCI